MSVILVFLVVIFGFAGWWLITRQGLMTKPWLETGAGADLRDERIGIATPKLALAVFLAVVGSLFALFGSAYFIRMEFIDWQPMPVPRILWVNTAMLVVASVALQSALVAVRRAEMGTVRLGLAVAAVATVAFLAGQIAAWGELVERGFLMTGNASYAFFYLLTGLHGLHIIGGLVALGRPVAGVWSGRPPARLVQGIELCTMYWHFLLLIWIAVFVLLIGWANQFVIDFINICRQLLS